MTTTPVFTSFNGKQFFGDEYSTSTSSWWNDNDTTNVYDSNGKIVYSETTGESSEFAETYTYDSDGLLSERRHDWYECGFECDDERQHSVYIEHFNQLGQKTMATQDYFNDGVLDYVYYYNYDDQGRITMETVDEGNNGLDSITYFNYNEDGSYSQWTDANMNGKKDEDELATMRDADGNYIASEDKLKDSLAPIEEVEQRTQDFFGIMKDFFAGIFKK